MKGLSCSSQGVLLTWLAACCWAGGIQAAEPDAVAPTTVSSPEPDTNAPAVSPDTAAARALEVAAHANAAAASNAVALVESGLNTLGTAVESLSGRLSALEQTLVTQHQYSLEAGRETARTVMLVAGSLALAALLGILTAALILSRAVRRMSDVVVAALPPARHLMGPAVLPALGPGEFPPAALPGGGNGSVEQVTTRFLEAIEHLEKRIQELEHSSTAGSAGRPGNGAASGPSLPAGVEFSVSALHQKQYGEPAGEAAPADPVGALLGKGQALLSLDRAEEALGCFDEAISLKPTLADAHVKRGMALERLQKPDAAIESYDRAVAVDPGCTLAWLYKGAVCNRLQRFQEALECYERALKTESKLADHGAP